MSLKAPKLCLQGAGSDEAFAHAIDTDNVAMPALPPRMGPERPILAMIVKVFFQEGKEEEEEECHGGGGGKFIQS